MNGGISGIHEENAGWGFVWTHQDEKHPLHLGRQAGRGAVWHSAPPCAFRTSAARGPVRSSLRWVTAEISFAGGAAGRGSTTGQQGISGPWSAPVTVLLLKGRTDLWPRSETLCKEDISFLWASVSTSVK